MRLNTYALNFRLLLRTKWTLFAECDNGRGVKGSEKGFLGKVLLERDVGTRPMQRVASTRTARIEGARQTRAAVANAAAQV